ncbi:MAG: histidine--tRNA ligase [Aestuariivirga sp.]|nr:histidine--tRNA ligase [Aestuariivirga sp.]
MASSDKQNRPKARLAKGFRDVDANEIRGLKRMLRIIEEVYENYGFEPVEQPFIEYTEALGKFLPDQDRPNEGVFSFQDDDEQWLSLRYDLTAPLARYVAENQQFLPTPFRSYRQGWVFRNEKPGPGRYRQFMQFDADTVGSASPAADAEVCMMAADTMEALGIPRGQYVMKVNNRKILDGVMIGTEIPLEKRLTVLRAIDKFDRLGINGVKALLGEGRKDESGDFAKGAELNNLQIERVLSLIITAHSSAKQITEGKYLPEEFKTEKDADWHLIDEMKSSFYNFEITMEGLRELEEIHKLTRASGYGSDRIRFDPSVVRGLEYYTGPVFECELLMEAKDEKGNLVRFGSVGGGGRYDDLVARFTGQSVPATGFSMGVSRLYSALKLLGKTEDKETTAPVVVLVMDKERQGDYQKMVQQLRAANIRAEMYVGTSGMKAQMKYADKRGSPLVVIQGGDEKARGEVTLKDLALGAQLASGVESREEYASQRLAQVSVPEADLVSEVKKMLARK